ncbi:MAG: hypothetical protein WC812_04680 [Candidatus Pacearchaeota archaeon]|jgi:predicted transcriptional regulator
MSKSKTREIEIKENKGTFSVFYKQKFSKKDYNFEGISALRQVLNNEKARILDVIKNKKPKSIYELAKLLNRPFKSVFDDVKLLERFGFVDFVQEKTKKRIRHRPELAVDTLNISFKI